MGSTRTGPLTLKETTTMPACVQYYRKGEKVAIVLADLDDELCAHLGVTPDPVKYVAGWFDFIGLFHALDKSHDEVRAKIKKCIEDDPAYTGYQQWLKILDYLEEHFTVNSWTEIGRRD